MKKTVRLSLLTFILLSLWQGALQAEEPIAQSDAIQAFNSWASRFQVSAASGSSSATVSEGVALAEARRTVMANLFRNYPEKALALAVSPSLKAGLPPEIAARLETHVSGIGDLTVLGYLSRKGGRAVRPIERNVTLDGKVYRAEVYGRRLGQASKKGIPMHGIVLDDVLVLDESPVRELADGEKPDTVIDLRSAQEQSDSSLTSATAEIAGKFYRFASVERLHQAQAQLVANEAGISPTPLEPTSAVLSKMGTSSKSGAMRNASSAWTTGVKKVLVIRVDFSDLPGDPIGWNDTAPLSNNTTAYTSAYVQDLIDKRISSFYLQSSYGLTSLSNTVTTQLYRLPQTTTTYATTVTGNDQLHSDATTAAAADYDLANYDRIVVLFSFLGNIPNSLIDYGGLAEIVGKKVWLNGEFDFRVVSHELGHTYGLFHAGLWSVTDNNPISLNGSIIEYGDDYDTMGANFANDSNTDFNPYYKNLLGWLTDDKVQTASTNGSYRIYAFDTANYQEATNNNILALKFVKDANRTYWIGTRRNFKSNNSMNNGAYVFWAYNFPGGGGGGGFQSGLLDLTTPGTAPSAGANADIDAALAIGANFNDPSVSFSITPVGGDNSVLNGFLDVQIGNGANLFIATNVISGGNGNDIIDFNECNNLEITLTNIGLTASDITATLTTITPEVIIAQPFSLYPNIPTGSSGKNLTPFKISTSPSFPCGTEIEFALVVKSDVDTRTNFFRLPTGLKGAPVRFDSVAPVSIPDADPVGASSPIVVSNFNSTVSQLTVGLYITHTFTFDLQLQLIAPDGTSVILSQNRGGQGDNFGSSCSPDNFRTRFDDSAILPVSAGNPPFIGTFRPDQPLSNLNLKSGTNVNGIWRLKVVDQIPIDTGTIQCWSLFLSPQICTDGGGECAGSDLAATMIANPNPAITSSNLTYTIQVTNNGPSTAKAVVLSQTLPTGATFISATNSQGTFQQSGGVLTCNLGTISARKGATVTVVVRPSGTGIISSTATVGSSQSDPDPSNNSVTVTTRVVPPSADLAVVILDSPDPVSAGGNLTYTVTVTNRGPTSATHVILSNTLPATAAFISANATQGTAVNAGGTIIYNFGTLTNGGGAVATVVVRPTQIGAITATSRVSSDQADLIPGDNIASATTTVTPAADVALSIVDMPDPAVLGSNVTYIITVTNHGPNLASGVLINGTLPSNGTLVFTNSSQGSLSVNGNSFLANIGALGNGSATLTFVITGPAISGTMTLTANASGGQADPNPTNNSATATTQVSEPTVAIIAAGSRLTAESIAPANGAIEPNETVSVELRLQNVGNISTTNLVATLLTGSGVTSPSGAQVYGVLSSGGAAVAKTFSFTASGVAGQVITATLQLQDGSGPSTNVSFNFTLPVVNVFANTNVITIPDHGLADPYPSQIQVSGVTGLVDKVTVALNKLHHTYPDDVDILLVDPTGRKVLLMSDSGGANVATNVNLTFDATAASLIPNEDQLVSASFIPADYSPVDFFSNAPAGPYGTLLEALDGTSPNGTWSLYVVDDTEGDFGGIQGGWSLAITTITPVNKVVDLAVSVTNAPVTAQLNQNVSYTFVISNHGPDTASNVTFNNPLPLNATAVSALSGSIGDIPAGSNVAVTVTLNASAVGFLTNSMSVGANEIDLNPSNNSAKSITSIVLPLADVSVALSGPSTGITGNNHVYTLTVANNGPDIALNVILTNQLPNNVVMVSASGSPSVSGNVLRYDLGNIGAGTSLPFTITVTPLVSGLYTNRVNVTTRSADSTPANNFSSLVTTVANPSPSIAAGGATLLSESSTVNGGLDLGETVTMSLRLANIGTADTANLVATLQTFGGVTSPSAAQNYGVVTHGGAAVGRDFTFTVNGAIGGIVTARLQLQDGASSLGFVNFTFALPKSGTYTNTGVITVPNSGPATPYPSTISVSGATGAVDKVVVTLTGLSHSFPDDLDVLLVSPDGQKLMLMSDVGGSHSISGVNLVFTNSGAFLSDSNQIISGQYRPSDFELGDAFSAPAPAGPYASTFSTFNGSNPNGDWQLYVNDDAGADFGAIANGWSIALTTVTRINPPAVLPTTIGPVSLLLNGHFQMTVAGDAGANYRVEMSSNLTTWSPISTNTAGGDGKCIFTDTSASGSGTRFYRAVRLP